MTTSIERIVRLSVLFLGLLAVCTARADTKTEGFAFDHVVAVKAVASDDLLLVELADEYVEAGAVGPGQNFPLDTGLQPDPWTDRLLYDDYGYWGFANETGRVRTRIRTGTDLPTSSSAWQSLIWSGTYVRDSSVDPTFTLNPSWVEVRAVERGPQWLRRGKYAHDALLWSITEERRSTILAELPPPTPPYAAMKFIVAVNNVTRGVGVLEHRSEVSGIAYDPDDPLQLRIFDTEGKYDLNFPGWTESDAVHPVDATSQLYYIEAPYCINLFGVSGSSAECQQTKRDGIHFEIGPYTGRIDLDAIGVQPGETYQVVYLLEIEAGEDQREQFAEAYLADPLDNGAGGLTLETADSRVPGPTQICDELPDAERFLRNGDGTVTDLRSGLMWQRCPLGMTLDDRGTDDPEDDACTASATTVAVDWQTALQAADADSSAGYTDWRVPDVKSLESLVLPGCILAAADRLAFPDTPIAEFWSSTPLRQDTLAWQVDFAYGDVVFGQFGDLAPVRLVRDSGEAPQRLRPEVRIGAASVAEGAAGTMSSLRFPVWLSRSANEDVVVDWETRAESAAADADFESASGTLTIPAGSDLAYIDVNVVGDREAEGDEILHVELSNVSANARLPYVSAQGLIEDDEPRFRVSQVEVAEGDAGVSDMVVTVYLDRGADDILSLNYATADATATAGVDYVAQSGTLQFGPGESSAGIRVAISGDTLAENDETFEIEFSDADGLHLSMERVTATIVDDDGPGTYAALNDTGVTHCATGDDGLLSCPQAGLPLQDGDVGRDVTFNDASDGDAGFVFVKVDSNGADLAATAPSWSCVRDEVTGLVWENKAFDAASPHYSYHTFSWRNDSGINDGGDAGVSDGGECLVAGTCDTQQYADEMNAAALCGFTDWRLPTVDELFSISDFNLNTLINTPGVDSKYFHPNPNGDAAYWSATPAAGSAASAWMVQQSRFGTRATDYNKGAAAHVRLVRGGVQ